MYSVNTSAGYTLRKNTMAYSWDMCVYNDKWVLEKEKGGGGFREAFVS